MKLRTVWPEPQRRPTSRAVLAATVGVAMAVAFVGHEPEAFAHKNGIAAEGCDGCHQGGKAATVKLTASPMEPAIGQAVTLTITVSQTNGNVAGFYLISDFGAGKLSAIESGTTMISSDGVSHSMPRTASGGQTTFHAQWTSDKAAGVVLHAYGLSANGDGKTSGDGAGDAVLALAAGCGAGKSYYIDQDGDGYGSMDPVYMSVIDCSVPQGYADNSLDCDDFRATSHPGAPELCDGKDNDCNGKVDDLCGAGSGGGGGGAVGGTGGRTGTGGAGSGGVGSGGAIASGGVTGGSGGVGGSGGAQTTASGGSSGSGSGGATGSGGAGSGGTNGSGGTASSSGGQAGGGATDSAGAGGCSLAAAPLTANADVLLLLLVAGMTCGRRRRRLDGASGGGKPGVGRR